MYEVLWRMTKGKEGPQKLTGLREQANIDFG